MIMCLIQTKKVDENEEILLYFINLEIYLIVCDVQNLDFGGFQKGDYSNGEGAYLISSVSINFQFSKNF